MSVIRVIRGNAIRSNTIRSNAIRAIRVIRGKTIRAISHMNSYFQFKQFTIHQDKCAMKVCTDACLFGALLPVSRESRRCLDIGTGTGLLSLMLAQKDDAVNIDAVELDTAAALQASENVAASPWASRIQVIQEDVLHFNPGKDYDLIFSNPPFFEDDLHSPNPAKNKAKHNTGLTLTQLVKLADGWLSRDGVFAILLPYHRVDYFIAEAGNAGLHLHEQVMVKQTSRHDFFRGILFFTKKACTLLRSDVIIKDGENNYTPQFTAALKDYYLYL